MSESGNRNSMDSDITVRMGLSDSKNSMTNETPSTGSNGNSDRYYKDSGTSNKSISGTNTPRSERDITPTYPSIRHSQSIRSSINSSHIGSTGGISSRGPFNNKTYYEESLGSNSTPIISLSSLEKRLSEKLFPYNHVLPKITVLIVEDNVINQMILSNFLKRNNIPYKLVSNGKDALKAWRKGGYQLILMDIQLPLISGIYCTKEIRRLESLNGIGISPKNSRSQKSSIVDEDDDRTARQVLSPVASSSSADNSEISSIEKKSKALLSPEIVVSSSSQVLVKPKNISDDSLKSPLIDTKIQSSPNPLSEEFESDKLDVSKFKSPVIIVALTANSFTEDRDNALAAGCNDFLVKPVNLHWLGKKFAEWGCMQALINFDDWESASRRKQMVNISSKKTKEDINRAKTVKTLDDNLRKLFTLISEQA